MGPVSSFLGRLVITTLAALLVAYLLPGVNIDSGVSAFLLALVLALLNAFVKPLLVFLTLPFTIVTFGLFLVVINALIIMLADKMVPGFSVDGFWWALLFSIILSLVVSAMETIAGARNQD
jgi:putative membrane protein